MAGRVDLALDELSDEEDVALGERLRLENQARKKRLRHEIAGHVTVDAAKAHRIKLRAKNPTCAALSTDDTHIWVGDENGHFYRVDRGSGNRIQTVKPSPSSKICSIACSESGTTLVTGHKDGVIRAWDTRTTELIDELRGHKGHGHRGAVTALAFQSDDVVVSASTDRSLKLWSVEARGLMNTMYGHSAPVLGIDALPGGRCVSASDDRQCRSWNTETDKTSAFRAQPDVLECVRYINPEYFVTGSSDGRLCLWHREHDKPVVTQIAAHGTEPVHVFGSNMENRLEAKMESGLELPPRPHPILSLATIPSTDLCVSGSTDGCVRLWQVCTAKDHPQGRALVPLGELPVEGFVNGVCVSRSVVVAVSGKHHRMGRWTVGPASWNGITVANLQWDIDVNDITVTAAKRRRK